MSESDMNKDIIILGMAKSNQNLNGAKGPKLELDLLRLIYAVKEINTDNESDYKNTTAYGVLVVANESIEKRANGWIDKYNCSREHIKIHVATLSEDDMKQLESEKLANASANISHVDTTVDAKGAISNVGRDFYEEKLREHCRGLMRERDNRLKEIETLKRPFGIQWDCLLYARF